MQQQYSNHIELFSVPFSLLKMSERQSFKAKLGLCNPLENFALETKKSVNRNELGWIQNVLEFLPSGSASDVIKKWTHAAPVPWPINVTFLGSPPNFSETHKNSRV